MTRLRHEWVSTDNGAFPNPHIYTICANCRLRWRPWRKFCVGYAE